MFGPKRESLQRNGATCGLAYIIVKLWKYPDCPSERVDSHGTWKSGRPGGDSKPPAPEPDVRAASEEVSGLASYSQQAFFFKKAEVKELGRKRP